MNDLISRSALLEKTYTLYQSTPEWPIEHRVVRAIDVENSPTVEARPVVHAKWIFGSTLSHEWMKCSNCLKSQTQTGVFTYCPNCGATMDLKEATDDGNT